MAASLTTSQEQPATLPLDGTELVRIVQGGSSARTTRGELSGTASRVSLVGRGIDGTGTVDVTAAVQLAIDNVASLGGGVVDCSGGRWLIDSGDLIVKKGVTLWGPWLNLGEPDGQDYSNIQSAFIVNPLYTIRLSQEFSALRGLGIFRKGLTNPTTVAEAQAEIAAFAGTAITVGYGASKDASDTYVGFCHVNGFEYAYYCDWNERPRVEYLSGDNTNGICMKRVYDMAHIMNCHFWPFVTAHKPFTLTNDIWRRQGIAYSIGASAAPDDWGQAYGCFDYGHDVGFDVYDSSNVMLVNCGADNWKTNDNYSIGCQVRGNCQSVNLIGFKSSAKNKNALINITGTYSQVVKIIGGNLWANSSGTGRGVDLQAGSAVVNGVSFFDGRTGIYAEAGAGIVSVDNCTFDSIVTPLSITDKDAAQIGPGNIFIGSIVDSAVGRRYTTDGLARATETSFRDVAGGVTHNAQRARGTLATPAALQLNDEILATNSTGWDGADWVDGAQYRTQVQGTVSAGIVPMAHLWTTRNTSGAYATRLILHANGYLYPATDNTYRIGASSNRWSESWTVDAHTFPLASVTPTINGELVVQATSDTSLTFKYRGSDGTVRSASLTLA